MSARARYVSLAAVCAGVGFVAGLHAHSLEPIAAPAKTRPCPTPTPCPAMNVHSPPASVAKPAPPPPRAAAPAPVRPQSASPAASPTSPPLAGFRFLGIGPAGGLRLARVRDGSLPAALGLKSGDELLSINDYRLSDPQQALTAYARLRYAERLNLVVRRDGQQTAIVYFVR